MAMQLILTQTIENLGAAGELVSVKNGYGRNYLLPQGLAVSATQRNVAKLEHDRSMISKRVARERGGAQAIADKVNRMTLQFERLVGEDEKMFGSVTARDLVGQLSRAGVELDGRKIKLDEPVRALGKYEVEIKIHPEVVAVLKFVVVGKEPEPS